MEQQTSSYTTNNNGTVNNSVIKSATSSNKGLKILVIALTIVLVTLVGAFGFYNYKTKTQNPTANVPVIETPFSSSIVTDMQTEIPSDWKTYQFKEIGLEFKLPSQIADKTNLVESSYQGETGKGIALSSKTNAELFEIGTTSRDFEQGRMGSFMDLQGWKKEGSRYYALGVEKYDKDFDITGNFLSMLDYNNFSVIKILGSDSNDDVWQGPAAGTPGNGYIGALVNIPNNEKYRGFAVSMKITEIQNEQLFDQILSTFQFTNNISNTSTSDDSGLKSQSIKYSPHPTWSTYTDEIAGFSIQYDENPTDPYNSHSSLGIYEKGKNVYFKGCMTPPSGPMAGKEVCTGGRWISVYNNYDGGSRRAWFSQNMLGYSQDCKKYYENLMLAGVNGLVVTSNCGSFGEHSILIPKGNKMIVISNEGFIWDEVKKVMKFDNFEISTLETFQLIK